MPWLEKMPAPATALAAGDGMRQPQSAPSLTAATGPPSPRLAAQGSPIRRGIPPHAPSSLRPLLPAHLAAWAAPAQGPTAAVSPLLDAVRGDILQQ